MIAEKKRVRRRPQTVVRRGDLPSPGGRLGSNPSRGFLRDLHRLDPGVELVWWGPAGRWVLYRCVQSGGCPNDDLLKKEVELVGSQGEPREPGGWLLDWMRRNDVCARYGTRDPDYARRCYVDELMAHNDEVMSNEKEIDDLAENFANDAWFAARGRTSVHYDTAYEVRANIDPR